jgi:hypothetical protein
MRLGLGGGFWSSNQRLVLALSLLCQFPGRSGKSKVASVDFRLKIICGVDAAAPPTGFELGQGAPIHLRSFHRVAEIRLNGWSRVHAELILVDRASFA